MELLVSELYLLVAAICGGITVIIYSRGRFGNTEINTKLKNRYNEYISQLETENKKLKGQVNRAKQPVTIPEELATENPIAALSEIVDSIPQLKPYRHLLKSKKAVDFVSNYVQQNPEAVKSIISKFTKQQPSGQLTKEQAAAAEQTL
jgi:ElaB/YqjD/DUF883 family membrane-anchored ribosome-binding protein